MKKPLRQLLKEYFYFPKKDRNGIIVLGILMVAVLAGYIAVDNIRLKPGSDYSDFKSALETWEHDLLRKIYYVTVLPAENLITHLIFGKFTA